MGRVFMNMKDCEGSWNYFSLISTVKYYGGLKSKKNIIFNKTNQKKAEKIRKLEKQRLSKKEVLVLLLFL